MKAQWFIGLDNGNDFDGPFTHAQLDEKVSRDESVEQKIFRKVKEPGIGFAYENVRYSNIPRFTIEFRPDIDALVTSRQNKIVTVLSGPNNSGKSLLLKHLFAHLGRKSCLLTCNRFSAIDVINSRTADPNERSQVYDSFMQQQQAGNYHEDLHTRQLEQLIASLNNAKQDRLFEIAGNF